MDEPSSLGEVEKEFESAHRDLRDALDAIERRIVGQRDVVERVLAVLLSGGHGRLVGPPGVAKTRLVETVGTVLGLANRRVQFTPDLMPADILGAEVLEETPSGSHGFRFIEGPVFTQLLMADEINRASPRTQSALLQAMQEKQVSVAGERRDLPSPFHVLATENPIEHDGTYPLPEAQLDRFLLQVDVPYPDFDTERKVVLMTTSTPETAPVAVMCDSKLLRLQRLVRRMPVGEEVLETILRLVRAGRPGADGELTEVTSMISWGPGPRAAQSLALAARARALLTGRLAPGTEDVATLAHAALVHRMSLTYAARAEGANARAVVDRLIAHAIG